MKMKSFLTGLVVGVVLASALFWVFREPIQGNVGHATEELGQGVQKMGKKLERTGEKIKKERK